MKGSELINKLKRLGNEFVEHGTNHDRWRNPFTNEVYNVPRHGGKEVPKGTACDILNKAAKR